MKMKNRLLNTFRFGVIIVFFVFLSSGCSVFQDWSSSRQPSQKQISLVQPGIKDADYHYKLARHFQKKARHELAVEEFKKAIQMNPDHFNAYNALGVSYDRLRLFGPAAEAYEVALKLNPDLDYVYNNIGYSSLLQNNLNQASRAFQAAIALNSQNKLYQNNLALVKVRQERDTMIAESESGLQEDEQKPLMTSTLIRPKVFTFHEGDPPKIYKSAKANLDTTIARTSTKKEFDIEISNGNGIYRIAKRVGKYLTGKGFRVTRLTNAPHYNYEKTLIYYTPGYYHHAVDLAQELPGFDPFGRLVQTPHMRKNIKVLIGQDIVSIKS